MCSVEAASTTSCHHTSTSSSQLDVLAGAPDDEHLLDRWPRSADLARASSTAGLSADGGAAAVAAVGGDDDLGLAVLEAGGQRVGGEAAEDHRVRGADAGAGQHRDDGLGDHRHVDRDPVAGLHAELGERVGGLRDLVLELGVGDVAAVVGRLADPVDRDLVAAAGLDVAVDAVVRRVELAADEPLRERRVRPVEHLVPLLVSQVEPLGLLGPERLTVGRRRGRRPPP